MWESRPDSPLLGDTRQVLAMYPLHSPSFWEPYIPVGIERRCAIESGGTCATWFGYGRQSAEDAQCDPPKRYPNHLAGSRERKGIPNWTERSEEHRAPGDDSPLSEVGFGLGTIAPACKTSGREDVGVQVRSPAKLSC